VRRRMSSSAPASVRSRQLVHCGGPIWITAKGRSATVISGNKAAKARRCSWPYLAPLGHSSMRG
jgi:hypothetical protein